MTELILLASLMLLFLVALVWVCYPLRPHRKTVALLVPCFGILVLMAYWQWGGWPLWREQVQHHRKQKQVQAVMQDLGSPAVLVEKLMAQLDAHPDSANGWYLLGRLHASQGDWDKAKQAFERAHQLTPNDEKVIVNYAQSLWQVGEGTLGDLGRGLLEKLLQHQGEQPDALALLAMDAFAQKQYQAAINYWQRLLRHAPEGSEESLAIRKAIAKAQRHLSLNDS